jgi:abortive infection bacteriophage resistance protein
LKEVLSYAEDGDAYLGVLDGATGEWNGNNVYEVIDYVQSVFPEAEYSASIYGLPESYIDYDDLNKLKKYGVVMNDDAFADYALQFIGYYHLGFYLFPFEKTYPYVDGRRRHEVTDGTTIEDVVALHDFDCDLRCILMKYLTHIELAFRNSVIYHLSQKYPNKPCWYLDKSIVDADVVDSIIADYDTIKRNDAIKHHNKKHRKSKYAPAWKTLEFETLGTIHKLYDGILRTDDKLPINRQFNVPNVDIFSNYIDSLRHLRNACAHGNIIMEIKLTRAISIGPAGNFIRA